MESNQNGSINLEQMIISLLTGININEINQYIIQFIETPESWTASTSLFTSLNEDVRYFAANIVYTKVRIHKHKFHRNNNNVITNHT